MSAEESLAALARDLVEEIAAGRALELAAKSSSSEGKPSPQGSGGWVMPAPPLKGAAAVHPHLGHHLARLPGDTICMHAYKHLAPPPIPSP
jgi:hypothetical protein